MKDLLVYLVAFDLVFVVFVKDVDEFVDVLEIEAVVDLVESFFDGFRYQYFGDGSIEGVDEEEELISIDSACVFKAKYVDNGFQVSLVRTFGKSQA
jgi:hypothetical protein